MFRVLVFYFLIIYVLFKICLPKEKAKEWLLHLPSVLKSFMIDY